MTERHIIFNADMVRATRDDRKTQTRRIIKSPAKNMQEQGHEVIRRNPDNDPWYKDRVWSMRSKSGMWGDYTHEQFLRLCPYGVVGDRLWVRESFLGPRAYVLNQYKPKDWGNKPIWYCADGRPPIAHSGQWHDRIFPSIHMPRRASRITLEITDVRVERLQDISEEDAIAEGPPGLQFPAPPGSFWVTEDGRRRAFRRLWESIYGVEGWERNPWVWVIEFKKIESENEQICEVV